MLVLPSLSALAITPLLKGMTEGFQEFGGERVLVGISHFLIRRFTDPSKKLPLALQRANNQAWRTLEIALAGESLWSWLDSGDNKAFRKEVRLFLEEAQQQLPNLPSDFRKKCLLDLQKARKANHLLAGRDGDHTAREAASFSRFSEPGQLIEAEWQFIGKVAGNLRALGYENLAYLLEQRPAQSTPPLLALSVRFFFRREVEIDPELFQGLVYEQIDQIGQNLQKGFSGLRVALDQKGQELGRQLQDVVILVQEAQEAVLDVRQEVQRQGRQYQDLYQAVMSLHQKLDVSTQEVRARDSLSIRNEGERQLIKELVAKYRSLPPQERHQLPALLNAIGKLEVAAGDFAAAQKDFEEVATIVQAPDAKGEAHYNSYHTLLEQGHYSEALRELSLAIQCNPKRFAPFPLDKYKPVRILGAGGFGVTFQCKYLPTGGNVAVKSLFMEGLDRDVNRVFEEAGVLDQIHHPAIVQLRECGFADSGRTRPFLVMSYFDGMTLEEHVKRHGSLSVDNFLSLAHTVAEAMQAAHSRSILHRDIKPANLLVRLEKGQWQIKVIDFGLALKQSLLVSARSTTRPGKTVSGTSIAGTIDYAAPEQMGKLPGAPIGPPADIFGFGKTSCYALFQTPSPMRSHWQMIPEELAQLLEDCMQEQPKYRLANFSLVLQRLARLKAPSEGELPLVLPVSPPPVTPPKITPPPLPPQTPLTLEPVAEVLPVRPAKRPTPPPLPPLRPRPPLPPRHWDDEQRGREDEELTGLRYRFPRMLSGFLGGCLSAALVFVAISMDRSILPSNRMSLTMLMIVFGFVLGAIGGAVVRSIRGWLFVFLLPTLFLLISLPVIFRGENTMGIVAACWFGLLIGWGIGICVKVFRAICGFR